jgi:hypothetical protein
VWYRAVLDELCGVAWRGKEPDIGNIHMSLCFTQMVDAILVLAYVC